MSACIAGTANRRGTFTTLNSNCTYGRSRVIQAGNDYSGDDDDDDCDDDDGHDDVDVDDVDDRIIQNYE